MVNRYRKNENGELEETVTVVYRLADLRSEFDQLRDELAVVLAQRDADVVRAAAAYANQIAQLGAKMGDIEVRIMKASELGATEPIEEATVDENAEYSR